MVVLILGKCCNFNDFRIETIKCILGGDDCCTSRCGWGIVVVVGYWWLFWGNGGSSGGDCFCIGSSYKSFRSDIVKCMLCG